MKRDLDALQANASQRIAVHQTQKETIRCAKHSKPRKYEIGQHVLVHRARCSKYGKSKKLEPKNHDPFVITKVLDNDRYLVEDMASAKRSRTAYTGIVPSDKLKHFGTTVSSSSSDEASKNLHDD